MRKIRNHERKLPRALRRRRRGNMIVLAVALIAGVVLLFILFGLGYIRILGSHSEQATAIESAAIAAAKDLSRIVVEDPNFGFISLSDAAPVGTSTIAGDRYFLPVHSINTLLGTIRLDLIVADQLNDPIMKEFIERDYDNALLAKNRLVSALEASLTGASGGAGFEPKDKDGQTVDPYESAVNAYKTNVIRQTGKSRFVEGSMRLTLGCLTGGGTTNIPVPKPENLSSVTEAQRVGSHYRSYTNVPFGDKDFVFAGIGDQVTLVDDKKFVRTPNGLPFFIPTIVRAEADTMISSHDGTNSHEGVQHAVASAQPFSVYDPKPAPGIISLTFPEGRPNEIISMGSMLNDPQLMLPSPATEVLTPLGGDYPNGGGALGPSTWTAPGGGSPSNTPVSVIVSNSIYDWLRKAGTKANIASVKAAVNAGFSAGLPAGRGQANLYGFRADGSVVTAQVPIQPLPVMQASENQLVTISRDAYVSSEPVRYDVIVRNQVNQRGRIRGGRHGGEPLDNPVYANAIAIASGGAGGPTPTTPTWTPTTASLLGLLTIQGNPWGGGLAGMVPSGIAILGPYGLITLIYPPTNPNWVVGPNNDFGQGVLPPPPVTAFSTGPGGGAQRPTYTTNGTDVDIRFRKQIPVLRALGAIPVLGGPRYKLIETGP